MANRPRIHYPGAVYHAMARGVDGRTVFVDDEDRRLFLEVLSALRAQHKFSILAYCLMGNHFHLAIKVSRAPLGEILQRLLTKYATTFNIKYARAGHLFQARYRAQLCLHDRYLLGLIRYIHLNPVRAGLVSDPSAWPWSSHENYLGKNGDIAVDRGDVFGALNAPKYSEHEAYAELLGASTDEFEPWPETPETSSPLIRTETPDARSIEDIACDLSKNHGISVDELRTSRRRRSVSIIRKKLLEASVRHGHSLTSTARWLNCTPGTAHVLLYGRRNQKNQRPDAKMRAAKNLVSAGLNTPS